MRWLFYAVNIAAAMAVMAGLADTAVSGAPLTGGHAEAAYRGWRARRAQLQHHRCGIDPNIDAGQVYAVGAEASGSWSELWVGADSSGPNTDRYGRGLLIGLVAIPLLAGYSGLLAARAGSAFVPWIAIGFWLTRPSVQLFENGFVELSLLGPLASVYLAGLGRFHVAPGPLAWCSIALVSALGWSICPGAWLLFFLPATSIWLAISYRHSWPWHGFLILAVLGGAAPFLESWLDLWQCRQFVNEALPAEIGRIWSAVGESTTRLAALIAIHAMIAAAPWLAGLLSPRVFIAIAATLGSSGLLALIRPDVVRAEWQALPLVWARPAAATAGQGDWWSALAARVDPTARVLVEAADDDVPVTDGGYTAALWLTAPILIGAKSEGTAVSWQFARGKLGGRPLSDWSDDDLNHFLDRWNISWVIARSPDAIARFRRHSAAISMPLPERSDGAATFAIQRNRSYVLTGNAKFSIDEAGGVLLTDAVADGGELVLSLRHHIGWSVKPSRVAAEAEIDPYEPCPALRLRFGGTLSRISLFAAGD